jgi:hypothetical protein
MAYGKTQLRPSRSSEKIKPLDYPETKGIQKGKTGMEGADKHALMDMGGMPSSGNFQSNAGGSSMPGGSAVGSKSSMKGEGGTDRHSSKAMPGSMVKHNQTKKPLRAQSKGGSGVNSIDTLTKLIFHPKGGLGYGKPRGQNQKSGFKDSGKVRTTTVSSGVSE